MKTITLILFPALLVLTLSWYKIESVQIEHDKEISVLNDSIKVLSNNYELEKYAVSVYNFEHKEMYRDNKGFEKEFIFYDTIKFSKYYNNTVELKDFYNFLLLRLRELE